MGLGNDQTKLKSGNMGDLEITSSLVVSSRNPKASLQARPSLFRCIQNDVQFYLAKQRDSHVDVRFPPKSTEVFTS